MNHSKYESDDGITNLELVWQGLLFLCIIYTAIEAPYTYSLEMPISNATLIVDTLISFLFAVDIFLTFKVMPERIKARLSSTEYEKLMKMNKRMLPIDMMATIPYDLIGVIFNLGPYLNILRLVRLLRLIRMVKLIPIFNRFPVMSRWFKVAMVTISSMTFIHWMACIWMAIYPNVNGEPISTFYNKAVYWSVTTLTTIGYGDITPNTNGGRIYTMMVMILGVAFYGVVMGFISRAILEADRHKEKHNQKLQDLNLFMGHYRIPRHLQKQVFGFYKHLMTKRLSDNDSVIIKELPVILQQELQVYMNIRLISNAPVFRDCSLTCLKMIASCLEQIFYSPNDIIIEKGEMGNEMYIISHGTVEILNDQRATVATLKEGQCFGEIALLEETKRNANVQAKDYCDLYKLSKENFLNIIEHHPQLKKNFERVMARRQSSDEAPKIKAS